MSESGLMDARPDQDALEALSDGFSRVRGSQPERVRWCWPSGHCLKFPSSAI